MKMITIEIDESTRLRDVVNAIGDELRKRHPGLQDSIVLNGSKPVVEETCIEYVKLVVEDDRVGFVYDVFTRVPMLR